MAFNSINTNAGAVVALQSLNETNAQLDMAQKRVSTGFRVADARDDGGAFAVAQKVRGDIAGVTSANEQLGAAKGLLDTTLSGLNRISDTMASVRAVVVKLADNNVTGVLRDSYTEQYNLLRNQISTFVNDSTYNGVSLIGRSAIVGGGTAQEGVDIRVVRNETGGSLSITGQTLLVVSPEVPAVPAQPGPPPVPAVPAIPAVMGTKFDLVAAADDYVDSNVETAAGAWQQYLTGLDANGDPVANFRSLADVETDVNAALNTYGNASKSITNQIGFNKDKIDALESGLGALIDADLAKESARLQSLQIRQQLGATALSAANSAPQFLLSLFR
jgi:flagellin